MSVHIFRYSVDILSANARRRLAGLTVSLVAIAQVAGINPNEIQEDTEAAQPQALDWPERQFPDPSEIRNGINPGEMFQFRGQWGIFRKVGQITISTEVANEERPDLLLVRTLAKTTGFIRALFPLMLEGRTLFQSRDGRIIENRVTDTSRSNEKDALTRFDFDSGLMSHVDSLRPERNQERSFPYPAPMDYASAILQIRGWDLASESRYPLFISSSGKFYLIEMESKGVETISTQFGKMEAFRVEPVSAYPQSRIFREGGKMAIWISNDEKRIPLRLDVNTSIGTASMKLEAYTLNKESIAASQTSASLRTDKDG